MKELIRYTVMIDGTVRFKTSVKMMGWLGEI